MVVGNVFITQKIVGKVQREVYHITQHISQNQTASINYVFPSRLTFTFRVELLINQTNGLFCKICVGLDSTLATLSTQQKCAYVQVKYVTVFSHSHNLKL